MSETHAARQTTGDLRQKIIIALDVSTAAEAEQIVDELRHDVGAFKIGLQLFTAEGPSVVRRFTSAGLRIFLDLKFHDIPNTVAHAGAEAARLGAWMFNVHASGGADMMRMTAELVGETCEREQLRRPLVVGVSVLTSLDDLALPSVGILERTDDHVLRLSQLAADSGLDGIVASALEAGRLRHEIVDPGFCIVTPGIRPLSATSDDQKRVTTVRGALANSSDYVVIGRSVVQADDRRAALAELLKG